MSSYTETQLMLAYRLEYVKDADFQKISKELEDIMRMLSAFIKKLSIGTPPNE